MSFGANLERIRKDKKVSQAKLGKELGITQQMVSSYEKEIASPNVEVLIKIADYFNISIDTLVGHEVKNSEINPTEARFFQYFKNLTELDRERCVTIAKTLLEDRAMNKKRKIRSDKKIKEEDQEEKET